MMTMLLKGLEFDVIFLPGWEEGLFQIKNQSRRSQKGLEEERRLLRRDYKSKEKSYNIIFNE